MAGQWHDQPQGDDPYGRAREGDDGRVESLRDGALGNRPGDDHAHVVGRRGDPNAAYVRDRGGDVAYDSRWDEAHRRKLDLVGEAERLVDATDFKAASARQRELMERWKQAGFAGPVTDDELWQRFRAARQRYFDRADRFFRERNEARERARHEKQALVSEAQSLAGSTDWKSAGERFRSLWDRWKAVGNAGEHEERLFRSFVGARDEFRDRRTRHFEELDRRARANASAKEQLVTEARRLAGWDDKRAAKQQWEVLMGRWKATGRAGDREQQLREQFRAAKDALYDAAAREWREKQSEFIRRKEGHIRGHQEALAKLESLRGDLMNRRHNVMPGKRELELKQHYDGRIAELDDAIARRRQWLDEDVRKLNDARARL